MGLLLATFTMGVVSALFPLVNMEAFIVGVGAMADEPSIWVVALVGGLGQAVGKVPWYEVSRTSLHWGFVRKKLEDPRWQTRYQAVHDRVAQRPLIALVVLFASSLVAVPPLAITTVLAGQLEVNRALFYSTVAVGRALQFAALLLGVGALAEI
jgi:membrane protein YqaA with SNARE-associated domain